MRTPFASDNNSESLSTPRQITFVCISGHSQFLCTNRTMKCSQVVHLRPPPRRVSRMAGALFGGMKRAVEQPLPSERPRGVRNAVARGTQGGAGNGRRAMPPSMRAACWWRVPHLHSDVLGGESPGLPISTHVTHHNCKWKTALVSPPGRGPVLNVEARAVPLLSCWPRQPKRLYHDLIRLHADRDDGE